MSDTEHVNGLEREWIRAFENVVHRMPPSLRLYLIHGQTGREEGKLYVCKAGVPDIDFRFDVKMPIEAVAAVSAKHNETLEG